MLDWSTPLIRPEKPWPGTIGRPGRWTRFTSSWAQTASFTRRWPARRGWVMSAALQPPEAGQEPGTIEGVAGWHIGEPHGAACRAGGWVGVVVAGVGVWHGS